MAKALVLTVMTGSMLGKKYPLAGRTASIGSDSSCDLVLHDRLIEPRHAEIQHMLESWFIVPLSKKISGISVNGTIVQGKSRMRPGDQVTIGSITYAVGVEELAEREVGY